VFALQGFEQAVHLATTARLSYALGEAPEMPGALATTRKGVPVVSILTAAGVGSAAVGTGS
jgi:hypothetical protein